MVENKSANPAPLGLFGFGTATILLSLSNIGLIELSTVVLSTAVFLGGLAQIIAGIFEMKFKNTFGATTFISLGLFWVSLAMIWLLGITTIGEVQTADPISMAFYLLIFGCFTSFMFISSLKLTKILQVLFGLLSVLFFLLAATNFTGLAIIKIIAGYLGIFLGATAIYACIGQVINNEWEKDIIKL